MAIVKKGANSECTLERIILVICYMDPNLDTLGYLCAIKNKPEYENILSDISFTIFVGKHLVSRVQRSFK